MNTFDNVSRFLKKIRLEKLKQLHAEIKEKNKKQSKLLKIIKEHSQHWSPNELITISSQLIHITFNIKEDNKQISILRNKVRK